MNIRIISGGLGDFQKVSSAHLRYAKDSGGNRSCSSLGNFDRQLLKPVDPDVDFMVGDLKIHPFKIDHDAADPVAYRVDHQKNA